MTKKDQKIDEKMKENQEEKVKEDLKDETLENENNSSEQEKDKEDPIKVLEQEKKALKEENKKFKNELEALKDRLERMASEYDNYRKRTAKEKEGIYDEACEDVLKEMLPALDNLERAVAANGSLEDLKTGIEMTLKQFKDSFEKLGVEEIAIEDGFDPNFHNAVMHVEDDNYKEKQVVEVFQKGYKKGNKVIRYSMVKVAN